VCLNKGCGNPILTTSPALRRSPFVNCKQAVRVMAAGPMPAEQRLRCEPDTRRNWHGKVLHAGLCNATCTVGSRTACWPGCRGWRCALFASQARLSCSLQHPTALPAAHNSGIISDRSKGVWAPSFRQNESERGDEKRNEKKKLIPTSLHLTWRLCSTRLLRQLLALRLQQQPFAPQPQLSLLGLGLFCCSRRLLSCRP